MNEYYIFLNSDSPDFPPIGSSATCPNFPAVLLLQFPDSVFPDDVLLFVAQQDQFQVLLFAEIAAAFRGIRADAVPLGARRPEITEPPDE